MTNGRNYKQTQNPYINVIYYVKYYYDVHVYKTKIVTISVYTDYQISGKYISIFFSNYGNI